MQSEEPKIALELLYTIRKAGPGLSILNVYRLAPPINKIA